MKLLGVVVCLLGACNGGGAAVPDSSIDALIEIDSASLDAALADAGTVDGAPLDATEDAAPPAELSTITYVKASNTGSGDVFSRVAISGDGNTFAVGAPREDSAALGVDGYQLDDSADSAGAVYVFRNAGNPWEQQAYIKAFNANVDDEFGTSVALSDDGNLLAVGAPREGSWAPTSGAVYVYERTGATWKFVTMLKASNAGSTDDFGRAIDLSATGDTIVVGAASEDSAASMIDGDSVDNSAGQAGAAYVFQRAGSVWLQVAYLKATNTRAFGSFGRSVAIAGDGDTVVIGASGESATATGVDAIPSNYLATGSGAAYVFTRTNSTWAQTAYLKASNSGPGDAFGWRVALSSDATTIAVGARDEDSAATGIDGAQANEMAAGSGAVYVFARFGSSWVQQSYIKSSNSEANDHFGEDVALSRDGNVLVAGAGYEDSAGSGLDADPLDNSVQQAGAVYVFERSSSAWSQRHYLKAMNPGQDAYFGGGYFDVGLAISNVGDRVLIGAEGECGSGTGVAAPPSSDACRSGAVYVFE